MPRTEMDLSYHVDYLSILDEDGNLDSELEPDLSEETLQKLHRTMLLSRRFDEQMLLLQREGRIGTFAPTKGQEAAQLGAVAALRDTDWMLPSFREATASLWRGQSIESMLIYYGGYYQANRDLEGTHNLPVAIPVATQIIQAPGIGYGIRYREKDEVAMVFFGDGATSQGDFHEALNFAGVFQTPVIFVCQNNQWAISVPRSHQTRSKTLAQKALAYGLPGIQVDGNDILAVYVAASEAVQRARSGEGPSMIECVTYRLSLHTTADDPSVYRDESQVEEWQQRDPLPRFQQYLMDKGLLSEEEIERLEKEIEDEIDEAADRAEQRFEELSAEPESMFDHIYAERTQPLEEQRRRFLGQKKHDEEGENAPDDHG